MVVLEGVAVSYEQGTPVLLQHSTVVPQGCLEVQDTHRPGVLQVGYA